MAAVTTGAPACILCIGCADVGWCGKRVEQAMLAYARLVEMGGRKLPNSQLALKEPDNNNNTG